jgi:alcohol dehydrogenase
MAIEQSMLGGAHACANPLTAHYGTTHGMAIAVMLPHVVRWNAGHVGDRYGELLRATRRDDHGEAGERLAARLETLARAGDLPATLRDLGVDRSALQTLTAEAATQWTGTFNPRPFDAAAAQELYERAF